MGNSDSKNMNQPQRAQVVLATKEVVTSQQVEMLLNVLDGIQPFLLAPLREGDDAPELDGGVHSSASTTFLKATNRLDAILDDAARWSTDEQNIAQTAILKTQACQQKFLEQQTLAAREVRRPAFIYRPTVYTVDGSYFAVWGDATVTGGSIAGQGSTPNEAMLDFDAAFDRTSLEQVQFILEHHIAPPAPDSEPVPETPLTVKPKKKKL